MRYLGANRTVGNNVSSSSSQLNNRFGTQSLPEGNTASPDQHHIPDENLIDHDDDDLVVASNTSVSGRAFESGRSFWLKLLLEHRDEHSSDEDDPEIENGRRNPASFLERTSLLGREIETSWSGGSPLSESSAFNQCDGTDRSFSPSSAASKEQTTLPISRRLSIVQQWERRLLSSRGIENTEVCQPEKKKTSQQPDATSSRRSFGDVTNQPTSSIPPATTFEDSKCKPTLSLSCKNDLAVPAYKTGEDIANGTEEQASTKTTQNSCTMSSPSAARVTEGQHSQRHAPKSFRGPKMEKIGPNLDDEQKFLWAYNTWQAAGLMKKRALVNEHERRGALPHESCSVQFSRVQAKHVDSVQFAGAGKPFRNVEKDATDDPICCGTGSRNDELRTMLSSKDRAMAAESIDPVPSTDSDHSTGFRHLLTMWRDQSKSHLLSPSPADRDSDCSESSSFSELEEGRGESPRTVNVTGTFPVKGSSMTGFGSVSIANVEDKNASREITDSRIQEVSLISVVSSELVPSNRAGSHDTLSGKCVKSDAFEDSDSSEQEYFSHHGESNRALVILQNGNKYDVIVGETDEIVGNAMVIRNLGLVAGSHDNQIMDHSECECSRSIFSGNDDLISFFLPQMGMACACGHERRGLINPEDPTAIENVLRPWQVKFLKSFGIYHGEQLVKARHRSADIMARALRQWRKKHDMIPFKTSSCGMALHIWAKTCKAYVRSIRKQVLAGEGSLERPPGALLGELSQFLSALPAAPKRKGLSSFCSIEPESQVEV